MLAVQRGLKIVRPNLRCWKATSAHFSHYIDDQHVVQQHRTLEFPEMPFFSFMEKKMLPFHKNIAMVDCATGRSLTYADMIQQSKRLASYFDKKGYKEKDVAAIHVPNCLEYPIALFGATANGMSLTTANPAYTASEINYQLQNALPKVLFTNSTLLDTARKGMENTSVETLILVDDVESSDSGVLNLTDILANGDENFTKRLEIQPVDDLAMILYSSGTTGLPKGVMLTHHNVTSNVLQLEDVLEPTTSVNNNVLCVLPMFHVYGLIYILCTHFAMGRTIYSMPGFDAVEFLTNIKKYQVHKAPIVPPISLFMLNHPIVDTFDVTSLKYVTVGAAPIDENVTKAFQKKFPHAQLLQGYGMTESMITHLQRADGSDILKFGSAGKVVPGVQWKVTCLESGKSLPPFEKGEVCTNGPQTMKGYLNNPDATSDCLTDDGWLRSGDIGYTDDECNIFVIDRLKELIKYKAFQVAPAELEDILLDHDEITDSCVIGIPCDRAGEIPRAFVVKSPSSTLTEDCVEKMISERVSDHKQLRGGVQFVDVLPKSPSGKLLRRVVKSEYLKSFE